MDFRAKIDAEAFASPQPELVVLVLKEMGITEHTRRITCAVLRDVWTMPWRAIAEHVGYQGPACPAVAYSAARQARAGSTGNVWCVTLVVRRTVLDMWFAVRGEVIEACELLVDTGHVAVERSEDDSRYASVKGLATSR